MVSNNENSKFNFENNSTTIYEPLEDSIFLSKFVKKLSFGKVLDMGTGSGIQGLTVLKYKSITQVTFVDINNHAIKTLKSKIHKEDSEYREFENKCRFIHSNLYESIDKKEKFDTIIFNPPYLPEEELDDEKLITTGGIIGFEIIERFLAQTKEYLNHGSIILLLFSSLTNKLKVDEIIKKLGYERNLLGVEKLFMEKLFVYRVTRKPESTTHKGRRGIVEIRTLTKEELNEISKNKLENNTYLEFNKRNNNSKFAIKMPISSISPVNLKHEAKILSIINKKNLGPKLIDYNDNEKKLIIEYVEGIMLEEFVKIHSKKEILEVIYQIINQCSTMDTLKISKLELTRPHKHVIIRKNIGHDTKDNMYNVVMIDFERAKITDKPKNVTQIMQFLTGKYFNELLKTKNIIIDSSKISEITKKYKKDYNRKHILDLILSIR